MKGKQRIRRFTEFGVVKEEAAKFGFSAPESVAKGERYISPNEAARILDITGEAVKIWIYNRRLPAVKLSNGYWKIKVSDLENFVKARQNLNQRRILIVDQTGEFALALAKSIASLGHEAVIAHNISDAMLKAVDLLPSVFAINMSANPADAWSLIEKIRKHRNLRRMAIILIADADLKEKDNARAIDFGVQGLLKRPISPKLLQDEIAKILSRMM